jgi:hypothetical protein
LVVPAPSPHGDRGPAHRNRDLEADPAALQLENDTFRVLQPDTAAARDRSPAPDRRIGPGEIGRLPQVEGAADEFGRRCADREAEAEAADAERIAAALEGQDSAPAADPDNEAGLGDLDYDVPVVCAWDGIGSPVGSAASIMARPNRTALQGLSMLSLQMLRAANAAFPAWVADNGPAAGPRI